MCSTLTGVNDIVKEHGKLKKKKRSKLKAN